MKTENLKIKKVQIAKLLKANVKAINSPIIINNLYIVLRGDTARVGASGQGFYENRTSELTKFLDILNFPYLTGNDAPRGGASGFFVKPANDNLVKRRLSFLKKESKKRVELAKIELEKSIIAEKEKQERFLNEKNSIKIDEIWVSEKQNALKLTGLEKNEAFISAFKGLLNRNNIEKVEFFYQLMKSL